MKRSAAVVFAMVALTMSAVSSGDVMRVPVKETLTPGRHEVAIRIYATADGGTPLAIERRSVQVDTGGSFVSRLGAMARFASQEERWLAIQTAAGPESPRVKLGALGKPATIIHVTPPAAITAPGYVESTVKGFRFPDGSVQTSAATVSGGVPSVNGIGTAVTIAGAGSVTVGTASSTITVTGPSYGSPVAISTSNADGVASTVARSDHAHAHGSLTGGSLHATATAATAGFMSASDKSKLDSTISYVRTIVVSPTGANATANGTLLVNALNNVSGNSSTNPYLLKIEPGVYDIGSNGLTMKSYVDIEGSGDDVTFINASRGSAFNDAAAAAVLGAAHSEIRHAAISNTSSTSYTTGIHMSEPGPLGMRNVTVDASGTGTIYGIQSSSESSSLYIHSSTITSSSSSSRLFGVESMGGLNMFDTNITVNPGPSPSNGLAIGVNVLRLTSAIAASTITVGGGASIYGVRSSLNTSSTTLTIDSSTVVAADSAISAYGLNVDWGTVRVTNSTLQAATAPTRSAVSSNVGELTVDILHSRLLADGGYSVYRNGGTVRVALSQLDSSTWNTPTCFSVYDANFASATCD